MKNVLIVRSIWHTVFTLNLVKVKTYGKDKNNNKAYGSQGGAKSTTHNRDYNQNTVEGV